MKSQSHYIAIDLLRIFAAMLVLLNHFATFGRDTASIVDADKVAFGFLNAFAGLGAVGVEIFFVISGFVIALSASNLQGLPDAMQFARLRATRILPALWLSAIVSLASRVAYGDEFFPRFMDFLRSILLSPKGPYIDGVVWSLVVECVFYAVVSIFIVRRRRSGASIKVVALIIGSLSLIYIAALYVLDYMQMNMDVDVSEFISVASRFPFKVLLLQHGVFFALGILVFCHRGDLEGRSRARSAAFMSILCIGCFGEIMISSDRDLPKNLIAFAIWSICVYAMHAGTKNAKAVERFFGDRKKVSMYLGGLSYPLYLNHYSTGMVVIWAISSLGFSPIVTFVLAFAAVLALSAAVLWLERKIRHSVTARISGLATVRTTPALRQSVVRRAGTT
jgi:peptidoglycan/LPS O-acetylase OafA/YrhL